MFLRARLEAVLLDALSFAHIEIQIILYGVNIQFWNPCFLVSMSYDISIYACSGIHCREQALIKHIHS
jgi:hypothetical protein